MKKLINYARLVGIFLIIELMLTFIMSLLNLVGINSGITTIIMLISNLILFFALNFYNAFKVQKKGFLEGIILGSIFLILMALIKIILFQPSFTISTFIYYATLILTSIFGGMLGVNRQVKNK